MQSWTVRGSRPGAIMVRSLSGGAYGRAPERSPCVTIVRVSPVNEWPGTLNVTRPGVCPGVGSASTRSPEPKPYPCPRSMGRTFPFHSAPVGRQELRPVCEQLGCGGAGVEVSVDQQVVDFVPPNLRLRLMRVHR